MLSSVLRVGMFLAAAFLTSSPAAAWYVDDLEEQLEWYLSIDELDEKDPQLSGAASVQLRSNIDRLRCYFVYLVNKGNLGVPYQSHLGDALTGRKAEFKPDGSVSYVYNTPWYHEGLKQEFRSDKAFEAIRKLGASTTIHPGLAKGARQLLSEVGNVPLAYYNVEVFNADPENRLHKALLERSDDRGLKMLLSMVDDPKCTAEARQDALKHLESHGKRGAEAVLDYCSRTAKSPGSTAKTLQDVVAEGIKNRIAYPTLQRFVELKHQPFADLAESELNRLASVDKRLRPEDVQRLEWDKRDRLLVMEGLITAEEQYLPKGRAKPNGLPVNAYYTVEAVTARIKRGRQIVSAFKKRSVFDMAVADLAEYHLAVAEARRLELLVGTQAGLADVGSRLPTITWKSSKVDAAGREIAGTDEEGEVDLSVLGKFALMAAWDTEIKARQVRDYISEFERRFDALSEESFEAIDGEYRKSMKSPRDKRRERR